MGDFTYKSWKCANNRVFLVFGPSIQAFEYCRHVLCVDGTQLYGKYNERLLVPSSQPLQVENPVSTAKATLTAALVTD